MLNYMTQEGLGLQAERDRFKFSIMILINATMTC